MRPAVAWGLVLAYMAFIALLSHSPEVEGPASMTTGIEGIDRLDHLAEYAVLGALLALALRARNPLPWPPLMVALLIGTSYGALDELHQSFVPGRDGDVFDWVADTLGVALGWWAAEAWLRREGGSSAREAGRQGRQQEE